MPKPNEGPGAGVLALFVLGSVMSVGVLPIVFWVYRAKRLRQRKPFFENGLTALARINTIGVGISGLGNHVARVTYEFEADGELHRGADQVLARLTDRWREGDTITILYLVEKDYDSIILSSS